MKTFKSWREIRDELVANDPAFVPSVPIVHRGDGKEESQESSQVGKDKTDNRDKSLNNNSIYPLDKRDKRDKTPLGDRLSHYGIAIAIYRRTGAAFLVFTSSEADTTGHLADVYLPFDVQLTSSQTADLFHDLEYYETLIERQ